MIQRGEDLPLARHSFREPSALPGAVRDLQRHRTIDVPIGALGQPDRAHAAAAELTHQAIRSHLVAGMLYLRSARRRFTGADIQLRQRVQEIAGCRAVGA
jgi:hypothetical protein